jgi:hypothetical protein
MMSVFNQNPYQLLNSTSSPSPPLQQVSSGNINLNDPVLIYYAERLARLEKGMEGIEQDIENHAKDLKDHNDTIIKLDKKPFHESVWFNVLILGGLGWVLVNFYTCIQDLQDKVITLEQQRPPISSQAKPKK